MKISLAPLQGYTDWVFRQAFNKHIGGIDEFYTPFLVLQNKGDLKTSHLREVEPFTERANKLVPQFLCVSTKEFQFFENYLSQLSYQKMNWNLGCPYPMVTKRGKGSGLLPLPDRILEILKESYLGKVKLSVKLRLGLDSNLEIDSILPILQQFKVDEIIVHPRIGKQLYKGKVNMDRFKDLYQQYGNYLAYNGDICSISDFENLVRDFPDLEHVMIGRGVLKDYWLPSKIKGLKLPDYEKKKDQLVQMHEEIYHLYST